MDSRRAESFSDGVIAVAITVLVFNLLPIAERTTGTKPVVLTFRYLGQQWPAYLAYVISFMTIGIIWLNHHGMFSRVTKVDRQLLVLNLFLLMAVVATPFPTALVADHLTGNSGGGGQATVAAVLYGLVMIAMSITFGSMWIYVAAHQDALGARGGVRTPRFSTIRFSAGNAGYVVGTLVALVSPVAALIIYGLLAVYYLFEQLPAHPAQDGGGHQGEAADQGASPS